MSYEDNNAERRDRMKSTTFVTAFNKKNYTLKYLGKGEEPKKFFPKRTKDDVPSIFDRYNK